MGKAGRREEGEHLSQLFSSAALVRATSCLASAVRSASASHSLQGSGSGRRTARWAAGTGYAAAQRCACGSPLQL